MKNPKISPVVYEYRYCNATEGIRNQMDRSRYSLFARSSHKLKNVETSKKRDLLIVKLGIIAGIAMAGYMLSMII